MLHLYKKKNPQISRFIMSKVDFQIGSSRSRKTQSQSALSFLSGFLLSFKEQIIMCQQGAFKQQQMLQ